MSTPVLSVEGYSLDYATPSGAFRALDDIRLAVARGEVLGLVGESGSGKTSSPTRSCVICRLPRWNPAARSASAARTSGGRAPREIDRIRGRRIGMVFQDPSTSLNPTLTLGEQVTEVLTRHKGLSGKEAFERGEAPSTGSA